MSDGDTVVDHVAASIGAASRAHGAAARAAIARMGIPLLEDLAERLAAAQHRAAPHAHHPVCVVEAATEELARLAACAHAEVIDLNLAKLPPEASSGIALAVSLVERGADVIALGASHERTSRALVAGLVLGAASMHVPVILDGIAGALGALSAVERSADVAGYLIAAHAGINRTALAPLALTPVFAAALGRGDGCAAALVLPLVKQVAAVLAK